MRRTVACAMASAVLPGLGQALQRRWLAAVLFGLQTAAVILAVARVLSQDKVSLLRWTVDPTMLHVAVAAGLAWAAVCAIASADAGRTAASSPAPKSSVQALERGTIAVITMLALVPGVAVAAVAMRQDAVLDTVFAGADDAVVAQPSPLSDLGVTTTVAAPTTVAPPTTGAPATTPPEPVAATEPPTPPPPPAPVAPAPVAPAPPPATGRWNIALLGGDAGPNRWGLRTDTMIVVSIDRASGDIAAISVPRNLQKIPMPPGPLRQRFPRGFDNLANAVYTYVVTHPDLGLDPAATVKGALAELLGIPIDNYVLVDMAGFVNIIDALGGVTIDLSKRVPLVPNIDGRTIETASVGPGIVHMNGAMALAFSRTRETDSDYGRMQRQRCLLTSVAREASASTLATNYLGLAGAVEDSFRSDIAREDLGELVSVFAKVDADHVRALALVPPVIQPNHPDIGEIRTLVAEALDPTRAAEEPAISTPTC